MIESFSIFGLHDERDVTITFERDKPYKILVAENGYGKTSILNAFYATLANDVKKLRNINFKKIEIKFLSNNKKSYIIERKDLLLNVEKTLGIKHSRYLDMISEGEKQSLLDSILSEELGYAELVVRNNPKFPFHIRRNADAFVIDLHDSIRSYNDLVGSDKVSKGKSNYINTLAEISKIIDSKKLNVLYLPTYRRIEESLDNLYPEGRKESISLKSINFGMSDVDLKIKFLTSKILKSLQAEFQKLNGQMLSKLINNAIASDCKDKVNYNTVELILERLPSEYLSLEEKSNILNMVKKETLSKNQTLYQFIISLIDVYSQQAETENLIREFITICNKYLVNKEFIYDENRVEVKIVRKKNGQKIDLHMLSSGEKQIVSLFSNIYLEKEPNMIVFFDEPQLSLSIEWQKMLLKDIIDSNKCKFLFATTHSPFIFDQLIEYTSDLSEYSKEI